jgi:transposase
MKPTGFSSSRATAPLVVSCDVGMQSIHVVCPALGASSFPRVYAIENYTDPIRMELTALRDAARVAGHSEIRLVLEPTGVYDRLLVQIAREVGFDVKLVNGEDVAKMRQVIFGDFGKTDQRDPRAIDAVATHGRLIKARDLPAVFRLMRGWGKIYQDAEDEIIEAKGRIHRCLKLLFPDFAFSTDFLYSASGKAIMRCYGWSPHRIVRDSPSRIFERLRRHSRIMRRSVERLLTQARASITSTPDGALGELAQQQLALAWEELQRHDERRARARAKLEELYLEARTAESRLPEPVKGVVSLIGLARLFAEVGPLDDFASWRQVLRYGGLNLCERKSGKYVGQTKISRKGRPQLRRILNELVLPLVRRGSLYGEYYHRKTGVEKMEGTKAMTAVSRKLVKMIWGWTHSKGGFDAARVFTCRAAYARAA